MDPRTARALTDPRLFMTQGRCGPAERWSARRSSVRGGGDGSVRSRTTSSHHSSASSVAANRSRDSPGEGGSCRRNTASSSPRCAVWVSRTSVPRAAKRSASSPSSAAAASLTSVTWWQSTTRKADGAPAARSRTIRSVEENIRLPWSSSTRTAVPCWRRHSRSSADRLRLEPWSAAV